MDKKLLISFSGAQSTGKTTLLKKLKEHNAHINFVPEVTRLIKREYGVDINEDGDEMTQALIITEHYKNIHKYKQQGRSTILDRCILDGLVYTWWLEERMQLSEWCYDYAAWVYRYMNKYDVIFYTDPVDVEIEDDGERSVDEVFRNEIIKEFEIHTKFHDNIVRLTGTVEERLQTIQKTLKEKGLDINIK